MFLTLISIDSGRRPRRNVPRENPYFFRAIFPYSRCLITCDKQVTHSSTVDHTHPMSRANTFNYHTRTLARYSFTLTPRLTLWLRTSPQAESAAAFNSLSVALCTLSAGSNRGSSPLAVSMNGRLRQSTPLSARIWSWLGDGKR